MTAPPSQPMSDEAPVTILRGWATAYRDSPEHRFPSDPHAEFFPVDMEAAADHIDRLTRLCDAYQGQVEAGAAQIEHLWSRVRKLEHDNNQAAGRIMELENALRDIAASAELGERTLPSSFAARARAALSGDLARG